MLSANLPHEAERSSLCGWMVRWTLVCVPRRQVLRKAKEVREQLADIMTQQKIPIKRCAMDSDTT